MKGMFDFLEKAGLVTRDAPQAPPAPEIDLIITPVAPPTPAEPAPAVPAPAVEAVADVAASAPVAVGTGGTPLNLDSLYASAGIPPAQYPAERLLRLVDGLSAMDAATRLMAITAMDAADESWTIADPLSDAAAKIAALAVYSQTQQLTLQQLEQETQKQIDSVLARQELVTGDIRKQIAELEALVARELARSAQETAAHQASLMQARNQTARELADIAQASTRLQSLSAQFGSPATPPQP